MKERPFKVRQDQRAGLKRAAEWHDRMSRIFRYVIAERNKYAPMIGYGEHLWKAEMHECAARELRSLIRQRT